MSNIKLYLIKYEIPTLNRVGIATVAASSPKQAQDYLQAQGKYNGYTYDMNYPIIVHTTDTWTAAAIISEIDNPRGEKGDKGEKGDPGDPMTWEKMDPADKIAFKEDAVADIESEIKTKYYPNMSVGMADNLVGRGDVQDAYINFRQSAGADNITDGAARIERIKGNSVAWNQQLGSIVNKAWAVSYSNYASSNISGGTIRVTVNDGVTIANVYQVGIRNNKKGIHLHRYLVRAKVRISAIYAQSNYNFLFEYSPNNVYMQPAITTPNEWVDISLCFEGEENSSANLYIKPPLSFNKAVGGDWYEVKDAVLIDLTQMFGAGNEPATVEEYLQGKPMNIEDEYAYNEGELIDMKVDSLVSVGDNAYKGGEARVMGNVRYDISDSENSSDLRVFFHTDREAGIYDEVEVLTDDKGQQYCTFMSDGYCYVENGSGEYAVCLNHSYHKGIKPYQQDVKDLSFIREAFPEGIHSAGSVFDEIRFNKTTKKLEKVTRVGVVDLGSLNWQFGASLNSDIKTMRSVESIDNVKKPTASSIISNILSDIYSATKADNVYTGENNSVSLNTSGQIYLFNPDYSDTQIFKQAMQEQGVLLYYELAEPIVEELDYPTAETNMDYLVWDFGTEEAIAVDEDNQPIVSAPFRADINYEPNAVDDLRWAVSEIRKLKAQIAQMQSAQVNETSSIE